MWNEEYVASVKDVRVKVDNYIITDINASNGEEYEFLFKLTTNFKHIEKYDTKKMLVSAYNVGKIIDDKFTYKDYLVNSNDTKDIKLVRRNLFLRASYETNLEYQAQSKKINEQLNKDLDEEIRANNDINREKVRKELEREIEKGIYRRKIDELFKLYNIQEKDYNNLIKSIKKFVLVCGVPRVNKTMSIHEQNLFSVILISHKIYTFIKNKGKYPLESKQTQTMTKEGKCKLEFDTVNDLLYSLAINYFAFKQYGYIICKVCGKMAVGNRKKQTCSERCKKIRNGSYNKIK